MVGRLGPVGAAGGADLPARGPALEERGLAVGEVDLGAGGVDLDAGDRGGLHADVGHRLGAVLALLLLERLPGGLGELTARGRAVVAGVGGQEALGGRPRLAAVVAGAAAGGEQREPDEWERPTAHSRLLPRPQADDTLCST